MESKIKRLELLDTLLVIGTVIIGIITVIDIFIPDPIFLLDEAALVSITGLLTYFSSLIRKKIEKLKKGEKSKMDHKDIGEITSRITETVGTVKKSRKR